MKRPKLFLPLLFVACCQFAFGQSDKFHIQGTGHHFDLNPYLQIFPAEDESLTLEGAIRLADEGKFVPYLDYLDEHYPDRAKGRPVRLDPEPIYWGKLELVTGAHIDDWLLFTGKNNRTEVYLLDSDGTVTDTMYAGLMVPSSKKDFIFGNQEDGRVRLNISAEAAVTVFLKVQVKNKRKPTIDLQLSTEDYFHDWDFVKKTRKDYLFIGFLLTFTLFSLLMYLVTRDRAYLYHSLFQFGIFMYLLEFFYLLHDLPWLRDHPFYTQFVIYLSLCGMDMAYLAFVRTFMKLKNGHPGWDNVFKLLLGFRLIFTIGMLVLFYAAHNMPLADDITGVYMMLQYLAVSIMLAFIRQKGVRRVFLIAGTLMFTLGVFLNAVSVIAGIGVRFGYTQIGVLGEVLLFSVGLGYRMKTLIKEGQMMQLAREMDSFKTRFYTNITHEFRTPLTVIQGFVKNLQSNLTDPKQQESLSLIKHNSERLTRLVNRMLDLSKLQSSKMPLNPQQGDMVAFLRYLVFSFQSFAKGKGLRVRFLTDLEHFEMDFDAEKIQDIMTNLISNAIKFTENGGLITVLVKSVNDKKMLIQLKDTGCGMSEEELEHVFERFYQTTAIRKKGEGSGLGLAITRELVKLMQGTIEISSEVGKGTVFSIQLPVARLAPKTKVENLAPVSLDFYDGPPPEHLSISVADSEKPMALIVEDNFDVVLYIKQLLEKDYNVVVANDGAEGVEKALSLLPDVIVSDVVMPKKDGLELCQTLKSDERTSHIPIILATAKATIEDRISGLKHGADAYLGKPFNENELFLHLQNFILLRKKMQLRYDGQETETDAAEKSLFEVEDAFVLKLRNIILEHIEDENFGTTYLARAVGMSRSQLHRKVTALTGHSASVFIKGVRLKKAKELLAQPDLNVSEVAYRVGLEPNYFSRIFKEEIGVTPTEFRNDGA